MAKKPVLGLAAVIATTLVVAGCTPTTPADSPTNATGSDWNAILEAAREEGTVNIGLHAGPGYEEFLAYANETMQEEFGIQVTGSTISVDQWANRVLAEQATGQYLWDLHTGPGGQSYTILQPADALELMDPWLAKIPDENKADDLWAGGFELWADPDAHYSFVHHVDLRESTYVNRDLVDDDFLEDEDDFGDLLDPSLAGQIVVEDPRNIGNSSNQMTWFLGESRADEYGEDFLEELMATQITVAADRETMARDFVQGRYPVAIGADQDMVNNFISEGLGGENIERLPVTNTGSRSVSIIKNPPHPNATLVFLNWFLSHEGQDAWARLSNISANSRRLDVEVYSPDTTPDYSRLDDYQPILGTRSGAEAIGTVIRIAQETLGR